MYNDDYDANGIYDIIRYKEDHQEDQYLELFPPDRNRIGHEWTFQPLGVEVPGAGIDPIPEEIIRKYKLSSNTKTPFTRFNIISI